MKLKKDRITLSPYHPTLLCHLNHENDLFAPIVVNDSKLLIDGYRRYMLWPGEEVDVVVIPAENIFSAAYQLNYRTRLWDEIDCLLWTRWANHLGISNRELPVKTFPADVQELDDWLLSLLAERRLTWRHLLALLKASRYYRKFFAGFLTEVVELNANEMALFINMACELKTVLRKQTVEEVFQDDSLGKVLSDSSLNRRQKGERLLKEMRNIRYPYYQRKSQQFVRCWQEFQFGREIQAKKNSFLERGLLEISFTAGSVKETRERIEELYRTLDSPLWNKLWEEE